MLTVSKNKMFYSSGLSSDTRCNKAAYLNYIN